MTDSTLDAGTWSGRLVVAAMYGAAVAVAGAFGVALAVSVSPRAIGHVGRLGPVTFALTPLNLFLYGVVMVGAVLALVLAGVAYVSDRTDAERPGSERVGER